MDYRPETQIHARIGFEQGNVYYTTIQTISVLPTTLRCSTGVRCWVCRYDWRFPSFIGHTPSPGLAVGPLFEASASTAVSSTNCTNTGTATARGGLDVQVVDGQRFAHLFGEAEGNVGPTSEPPNGLIPTVRRLPHRDEKVGVGDVEWPTCRQCRRCRRRLALVSSSRSAHRRRAGGLAE